MCGPAHGTADDHDTVKTRMLCAAAADRGAAPRVRPCDPPDMRERHAKAWQENGKMVRRDRGGGFWKIVCVRHAGRAEPAAIYSPTP